MNHDATIERLINSDNFENVSLALNLAIGQKSELAFSASERYVELFCKRQPVGSTLELFPTDFASECSEMAELFGMLPHECFQQFPWFIENNVRTNLGWAYFGDEMRLERSAYGRHEMIGRYWR